MSNPSARLFGSFAIGGLMLLVCIAGTVAGSSDASHAPPSPGFGAAVYTGHGTVGSEPPIDHAKTPPAAVDRGSWDTLMLAWGR